MSAARRRALAVAGLVVLSAGLAVATIVTGHGAITGAAVARSLAQLIGAI